MLRNFLIFTVFLIAINAGTMFLFPTVFDQTNEQVVTKLISSLTVLNLQEGKSNFSGSDLQTYDSVETGTTVSKSSGDTEDTLSTRGTEDFDSTQNTILGFFNLSAGYVNLMLYFSVPIPWIYTITAILGFLQLIGAFFFFQLLVSTFSGIIRGVL